MYYFGQLKNKNLVEVFFSKKKPTKLTHGNLYNLVYGGYSTKQEAILKANYQYNCKVVFYDGRKKSCQTTRNLNMIAAIA
jgi:hypothetical protein